MMTIPMFQPPAMTFHHTGIVVEDLERSMMNYAALFGNESISEIFPVSSQQVRVCFIKVSEGVFLELVQPDGENSPARNLLKKRLSYYHVGYKVKDIRATTAQLEMMNYKAFDYFRSEAFGGKYCIFLYSPDAHLIELIEE